jgi:ABC-type branched-subunit amino acid transport system permease subunit
LSRLRNDEALRARRQLLETSHDTISWPLMLALCAWLAVVFGVFGLLSLRNAVVYLSITTCAICVASALFLIDDFDSLLDGVLRAPSDSRRTTLSRIDAP